jgi:iron complex transport system ATP-binding protein
VNRYTAARPARYAAAVTALALHDVRFAYGSHEVLRGISLTFEPGAAVAIVGPNGSGKTTLLRVAGGLLPPTSGRVTLDGQDLAGLARRAAARLLAGVPAEEEAVFPYTVRETVALGRHPWRGAFSALADGERAQVDAALAATDLVLLAERPLPSLSSGERQRVALARCLVQDAPVNLLDEPTSHLDLGQRMRILRLLAEVAHTKARAVVMVLHDLNLAAAAADRILLLVEGRVVADGPPAEVFTAEIIRSAFEAPVHVLAHPQTGAPVIVPLSEEPRC